MTRLITSFLTVVVAAVSIGGIIIFKVGDFVALTGWISAFYWSAVALAEEMEKEGKKEKSNP